MVAPYDSYDYQRYWEGRDYESICEKVALEKFFREFETRDSLVDIGGGFGRLIPFYRSFFKRCTVLDQSRKLLEIGEKKFSDVSFVQGSLPNLPFKDESFETAVMVRVIHHLWNPAPSISEINRILVKKGYLIIEVANKIHLLSRVRAYFSGNFSYVNSLDPIDKRSPESIKENKIAFVNHHPQKILSDLEKNGFSVLDVLSVSNLRSPFIKRIVPLSILIFLEKQLQKLLGKSLLGPSVFILAQKM